MTPSISVVIPAHNAQAFLADALESVLRQTLAPTEIIVVDDGSSDGTATIAQRFTSVRLIRQENQGVSAARNAGVRESRSSFVAFLDADDVWTERKLEAQAPLCTANQFSFSDRTETDEQLHPMRRVNTGFDGPLLEGLLFHGNVVGTPSSVIAPREVLLHSGGFDTRLSMCADWDMWIRLSLRLSGRRVQEPLVLYRLHGSSMSTNLAAYEADAERLLENAFSFGLPPEIAARRREAAGRMWEMLAGSYWVQGSARGAFRCTMRALSQDSPRAFSLAKSVPARLLRRVMGPRGRE